MQHFLEALSNRQFSRSTAVLIVVAAFLAYANTFTGQFVWDDASSILLHKHVQDPSKFAQLFREDQHAFGRGQGNFYRPLVAASFMLDYMVSRPAPGQDLSPFVFHLTNTLWHAAASLLLFALLLRLGAPRFVSLTVPLIYVLHPLHTEAVAYISGRADMMSAALMYAALLVAARDRRSWLSTTAWAAVSGLCFTAALLSKESAFMLPLLLALMLFRPAPAGQTKGAVWARRSVPLLLSAAILGGYGVLRTTVLHFAEPTAAVDSPVGRRLIEALQAYALYMKLLIFPTGLHMERSLAGVGAGATVAGAVLLFATAALAAFAFKRKLTRVAMGLCWFILTWLPISGVFPLNAPMAEHWMYVPMAGLLWAAVELGWMAAKRPAARAAVAVVAYGLCVAFLALTAVRNQDWRDNESIFKATLDNNPKSTRVHYNLAVTYEDLLKNPVAARRHYEAVIAAYKEQKKSMLGEQEIFWDEELESHLSLGRIYVEQKKYAQAAEHYATLVRIAPTAENQALRATAAFGLGQCLLARGDAQNAFELFKQAAAAKPDLKDDIERLLASHS